MEAPYPLFILCVIIFYSVFKLGGRKPTDFLIWTFISTHAIVVLYALLQAFDLDPIDWGIETQQVGIQVFSTLGNANFSAGYVGITIPLVIWAAFGSGIKNLVKNNRKKAIVEYFLAILLLITAILIVIDK